MRHGPLGIMRGGRVLGGHDVWTVFTFYDPRWNKRKLSPSAILAYVGMTNVDECGCVHTVVAPDRENAKRIARQERFEFEKAREGTS